MNDLKTPNQPITDDPRTPSPNYFGLQVHDSTADVFASSSARHIRTNWSPPTSNVRSTAAVSPRVIPHDQNPDFEAFRKQSENRGGFALSSFDFASPSTTKPPTFQFPFPGAVKAQLSPRPSSTTPDATIGVGDVKEDGGDGAPKPRSPKRLLSTETSTMTDRPRRESPAGFVDGLGRTDELARFADELARVKDQSLNIRPSLPPQRSSYVSNSIRAETMPAGSPHREANAGPTLATPQHIVNILDSHEDEVLLLDLRVSTQYAKARITGALSLCIPTTLLKRASFNVQKLAETFKDPEQRDKFERWRSSKCIVVYDASSAQLKDAATCINMLKKFTNEGWTGGTYIIRGGFEEFLKSFPSHVTQGQASTSGAAGPLHLNSSTLPAVAPVIGGCPMPITQNAANPFFGNIRQNMDLIGGVGQLSLKHPQAMTKSVEEELPAWLKGAADQNDHGKTVADKFLHIEKREQKRMQEALSSKVILGNPPLRTDSAVPIQIAGMENGTKNRYNNIWPYEHSRVKLRNSEEGSDYVNANHIRTSMSNKQYIATQGPLPATFNDFWNVIWQQDVRVIVMLTAEHEGGQLKAHNYWSERQYGNLHLNPLGEHRASLEPSRIHRHREQSRASGQRRATNPPKPVNPPSEPNVTSPSSEQPYVIVRKFTLSNSKEPFEHMREITQLQYSHWPDFGAPAHPAHLLGLIEQCDAVVRQVNGGSASHPDPPNSRPVLVHCSAGCGRTGTFCTVDTVIDMLKRQRQARNARRASSPFSMDVDASSAPSAGGNDYFKSAVENADNKLSGSWTLRDDLDLIEKTVEDFRLQRLSMVQSLRQFVLCYESVLEWLVEQHPRSA